MTTRPKRVGANFDEPGPEFFAACLALGSESAVPSADEPKVSSEDARAEASPQVAASGSEHDRTTSARSSLNELPDTHDVIRQLKSRVEELREALAESEGADQGTLGDLEGK